MYWLSQIVFLSYTVGYSKTFFRLCFDNCIMGVKIQVTTREHIIGNSRKIKGA